MNSEVIRGQSHSRSQRDASLSSIEITGIPTESPPRSLAAPGIEVDVARECSASRSLTGMVGIPVGP